MRFFIRLTLTILILMFAAPIFAGGGHEGNCKLLGSWIGYDESGSAWWMSTADGQNASHGTLNLEVPSSKLSFDGAFSVTEFRGSWVKISENTYDWTVVGFPYLEDTTTMLLAKLSGTEIVSEDCNTLNVKHVVLELFEPSADINIDDPFYTEIFPDHAGHRILVNLP
jgi:hypothetical protein